MTTHLPSLSGLRIEQRLKELAAFTDVPGEMTRLTLSPAHKRAAGQVADWFGAAGMSAAIDPAGSVIGRYEGARPGGKTLIIGSHIDTVRNAGIYDGNLGVISGLAAVEALHAQKRRLPFAVEICAFGDEEGVRFPTTLTGSRQRAGRFDMGALDEMDADGVSRRSALAEFGAPTKGLGEKLAGPASILAYLEVHIEQGPVLEARGLPAGIVTALNGVTRGDVMVRGMAGHAGTLPMAMRRDALATSAEMILAIEREARAAPELVATVGTLNVPGGAVNVVPGETRFSFDIRAPADGVRRAAVEAVRARIAEIARVRNVEALFTPRYEAEATPCDGVLYAGLARAMEKSGITPFHLPSGAGHDVMSFRGLCPVAMLFVRCRGGISHNPAEYASPDDIGTGARLLYDWVMAMA